MRREPPAALVLACALALAGCAGTGPFALSAVRIGRVDFSETHDADASAPLRLALSKNALEPSDSLVASAFIGNAMLSKDTSMHVTVSREGAGVCDTVALKEVRNSRVDLRIDLRSASAGNYAVEVRIVPPEPAEPTTARATFAVRPLQ